MYVISGTTKQVDLNLHALGKGFLRESSILGKTIELSHSCLKDQEKGIGMCRRGGRYDIRWCVLATMSRWGCLEYKVMRDKNHMRKKMWYQEWMTLWVLEVMQKNLRLASYINCLPSQDTWNESVTDNHAGKTGQNRNCSRVFGLPILGQHEELTFESSELQSPSIFHWSKMPRSGVGRFFWELLAMAILLSQRWNLPWFCHM